MYDSKETIVSLAGENVKDNILSDTLGITMQYREFRTPGDRNVKNATLFNSMLKNRNKPFFLNVVGNGVVHTACCKTSVSYKKFVTAKLLENQESTTSQVFVHETKIF